MMKQTFFYLIIGIILTLSVHSFTDSEKAGWTDAERRYHFDLEQGGSALSYSSSSVCPFFNEWNLSLHTQVINNIGYLLQCDYNGFWDIPYNFGKVTYHEKSIRLTHWY